MGYQWDMNRRYLAIFKPFMLEHMPLSSGFFLANETSISCGDSPAMFDDTGGQTIFFFLNDFAKLKKNEETYLVAHPTY